jgi:hypothetical protein
MSCDEIQVRLADDVLGEISGVDHDAVAGHVAGCAACAGERRAFEEAIGVLREMDWPVVEPVLLAPHRERVEARAAKPVQLTSGRRRQAVLLSLGSLAAAAAVAAIAIPGLMRARTSALQRADSFPVLRTAPPVAARPSPQMQSESRSAAVSSGPPPASRKEPLAQLTLPSTVPAAPPPPMESAYEKRIDSRSGGGPYPADIEKGVEGGVAGGVAGGVVGGVVGGMPAAFGSGCEGCRVARMQAVNTRPHDMFFEHQGTNPFVATEEDSLSTFGLDVDTASYTVTRNYLGRGLLPPASAVRVEEFVNAMPQDRGRDAASRDPPEGALHPVRPGYTLLRVGLKAREVRAHERRLKRTSRS